MNKIRILLIDDSQQIRDFVIDYVLRPQGFDIDVATNGAEGLRKAIANPPDLVLLDFEMPIMTGPEVLQELRNRGSKVPAILMTSHGSEQLAIDVFRLGVSDYIIKPFEIEEMLASIEDALSVSRLRRERDDLLRRIVLSNQQLEQRVNELQVLYQVGKSVTTLMKPRKMLERVVEATLFVLQGEECTLMLIDSQTDKVIEQVHKKATPSETMPGQEKVFTVPLQMGQKNIGTLTVKKRVVGEFTTHDDQLLRMLADYAAIAIHNLQLMYQLQQNKEKEKQQIRSLFERYVAPTVVEQMLARPDLVKLGGTREKVAVIFADVRGFSTFSNNTSPEMLVELLNQYMRVAADAVLDQEGTLDKFMGDAVMAFFNAPLPQEDYPLRAVRAAWALQQSVQEVHANLPQQYHLNFGIGVGVGEAVVGNIGTPQMMNFTIIGDAVNKVKRLQENAKGGQILIDEETYHLIQKHIRVKSVGQIHLKGQKKPEPVYEVLGLNEFSELPTFMDEFADWGSLTAYTPKV